MTKTNCTHDCGERDRERGLEEKNEEKEEEEDEVEKEEKRRKLDIYEVEGFLWENWAIERVGGSRR